jgi:succinate dehydrogenase / fumarate reductase flavoprotein subunit
MQGLADGYFIIPYTIGDYLAGMAGNKIPEDHPEFKKAEDEVKNRINILLNVNGKRTVDEFHKELGKILWEKCGMARNEPGLKEAKKEIRELRADYWKDVKVLGVNEELNMTLEKALRVADFMELGELMIDDALNRCESCGGHFREESQTEEGEAKRDDEHFSYVSVWEYNGENKAETLHKEDLKFENVKLTQRSYK